MELVHPGKLRRWNERQALPGVHVEEGEDPQPPTRGQSVVHEVHRPALVSACWLRTSSACHRTPPRTVDRATPTAEQARRSLTWNAVRAHSATRR